MAVTINRKGEILKDGERVGFVTREWGVGRESLGLACRPTDGVGKPRDVSASASTRARLLARLQAEVSRG